MGRGSPREEEGEEEEEKKRKPKGGGGGNKVEAATHFQLQLSFSSRKKHRILLNLHSIESEP